MELYMFIGFGFVLFILFIVSLVAMVSHRMESPATDKIQLAELKKRVNELEKKMD